MELKKQFEDLKKSNNQTVKEENNKIMNSLEEVKSNKQLRKDIDDIIQRLKELPSSRERSLSITKLQEGVMWLGMDLKRLNEPNPYPNSKDPSNAKIEPTADGLKF